MGTMISGSLIELDNPADKRYEVELDVQNGTKVTAYNYNDETLARQKFAAILRTLDSGDQVSLYDLLEADTLLQYTA